MKYVLLNETRGVSTERALCSVWETHIKLAAFVRRVQVRLGDIEAASDLSGNERNTDSEGTYTALMCERLLTCIQEPSSACATAAAAMKPSCMRAPVQAESPLSGVQNATPSASASDINSARSRFQYDSCGMGPSVRTSLSARQEKSKVMFVSDMNRRPCLRIASWSRRRSEVQRRVAIFIPL